MADEIIFESLEEGSFDGILIAVTAVNLRTGSRKAFHEYPFRPGHDIEYTGREALSGTIHAVFVNGLDVDGPSDDLWPGTMERLRQRVQEQKSGPLVIPTIGKLPFASLDITDESYKPEFVDGTVVVLAFSEDSSDEYSGLTISSAKGKLGAAAAAVDNALALKAIAEPNEIADDGSSVTTFAAWVNNVLGQIDQVGESIALPVRQLTSIAQAASRIIDAFESLRTPGDWEVAAALRDLAAVSLATIAELGRSQDVKTYTTRAPTNVQTVARVTSNSVEELLALNEFYDPNDIDAGETLLVFVK